jgi:hypothetical protein
LLITSNSQDDKSIRGRKSLNTLADFRGPASVLRQRIRDNQKQKSFIAITKWAIVDAKRFGEKVKRLKCLIDGLEDISQAVGIIRQLSQPLEAQTSTGFVSSIIIERPPPYAVHLPQAPLAQQEQVEAEPMTLSPSPTVRLDSGITAHYIALKSFISSSLDTRMNSYPQQARPGVMGLTDARFKELRTDIYDEMMRRNTETGRPIFLSSTPNYHPKRNQARRKLASLSLDRFKDFAIDVVYDLERRFPSLQSQVINELEQLERNVRTHGISAGRYRNSSRRHGRVYLHTPLLLWQEASHSNSLTQSPPPNLCVFTAEASSNTSNVVSQISSLPGSASRIVTDTGIMPTDILRLSSNIHVSMSDTVSNILPLALKKYHLDASAKDYRISIRDGGWERILEMDEKPLVLFKTMEKEGKHPMFTLRRFV